MGYISLRLKDFEMPAAGRAFEPVRAAIHHGARFVGGSVTHLTGLIYRDELLEAPGLQLFVSLDETDYLPLDGHLSAQGHQRIAEAIAEVLTRAN